MGFRVLLGLEFQAQVWDLGLSGFGSGFDAVQFSFLAESLGHRVCYASASRTPSMEEKQNSNPESEIRKL